MPKRVRPKDADPVTDLVEFLRARTSHNPYVWVVAAWLALGVVVAAAIGS